MGFSLEMFFQELLDAMGADCCHGDKLDLLEKVIVDGQQYAKECGMIDNEEK
jgi:hypothetical protein